MPITSVEIMKTIEERKLQKQQKRNKQRQKRAKGTESIVKGWEVNYFVVHLNFLSFPQLICKASLIFMSNLDLALSIILKQSELYESKHVAMAWDV